MKASVHHVGYGQIEYDENFWTGKRELSVGGEKLLKKKKNVYKLNSENAAFSDDYCAVLQFDIELQPNEEKVIYAFLISIQSRSLCNKVGLL